MHTNPLKNLTALGQSIWLDYIKRDLLVGDKLKQLIEIDCLRGITSNPSIFEKAIVESCDYDSAIAAMKAEAKTVNEVYETLTQQDVCAAADEFRKLYQATAALDGYVSLEVNPHLSHDTEGTVLEARRLWKALARPNVLIKVPATLEGLPAIKQLISEGINVNVTLIFGVTRYQAVAEAYISGMEARVAKGYALDNIASVASFFISRIDSLVDPLLEKIMAQGGEKAVLAEKCHGQVAIASAKIAYRLFLDLVQSERFQKLKIKNAQAQRLLWASTSSKNPTYSDVKYIEALIGAETVNTVPLETVTAYHDHGDPKSRLFDGLAEAEAIFQHLSTLGIDMEQLTVQLENEGVEKFKQSFNQLMAVLEKRLA